MSALANIPDVWVTIPEAAEQFDVSVVTIRRWISQGRIDARRIGPRLIRVKLTPIEDLGEPLQYLGLNAR